MGHEAAVEVVIRASLNELRLSTTYLLGGCSYNTKDLY